MEGDFDREKISRVKALLSEIRYYEQMGVAPRNEIHVDKDMTSRIFKLLSNVELRPTDSHIGEYLRKRIRFLSDPPSDIEISSLRIVLGLLRNSVSIGKGC